jgi:hypothetical protein
MPTVFYNAQSTVTQDPNTATTSCRTYFIPEQRTIYIPEMGTGYYSLNWDTGLSGGTNATYTTSSYTMPTLNYEYQLSEMERAYGRGDMIANAAQMVNSAANAYWQAHAGQLGNVTAQFPTAQQLYNQYAAKAPWYTLNTSNIGQPSATRQATPEEVAAEADRVKKAEEEKQTRIVAVARGKCLVNDLLNSEERANFERLGHVDIMSAKDPGKMYRVRTNRRIGIVKLENGVWVEKKLSLCVHLNEEWKYVDGDRVAHHILLAKFDEDRLAAVANLHQMAA